MTKEIKLSLQGKNKGKYVALVDDEDFERVNQHRWFYNNRGYAMCTITKQKRIYMHRFILNAPNELLVDHIDGNGLHNEKHNLRLCNDSGNAHNMRKHSDNTSSQFKGVCRRGKKWEANISNIYLGVFTKEEDAARAYDLKARELFGEFARTNFT